MSHFKVILQFTVSIFIWFFNTNYNISCVHIFIPSATHKYSGLCNSLYNHCQRSLLCDILVLWTVALHRTETVCKEKTWRNTGWHLYLYDNSASCSHLLTTYQCHCSFISIFVKVSGIMNISNKHDIIMIREIQNVFCSCLKHTQIGQVLLIQFWLRYFKAFNFGCLFFWATWIIWKIWIYTKHHTSSSLDWRNILHEIGNFENVLAMQWLGLWHKLVAHCLTAGVLQMQLMPEASVNLLKWG